MNRRISNTFTITTIADGKSQPSYIRTQEAWSNDATTASSTTAPTIVGSWSDSTPPKSATYLWRRSRVMVLNVNTREYEAQGNWTYQRLSGENGTSIHVNGEVALHSDLETNGYVTPIGGTRHLAVDGESYTLQEDWTDSSGVNRKGHLFMWSTESSAWIPLGQFQGQNGLTYYTHIVWAEDVVYSDSTVTSITGYASSKSPSDTTHLWMGTYVDLNPDDPISGDDQILKQYTWSYTKGAQGDGGVVYSIECSPESVKILSDASNASWRGAGYFYKTVGGTRNLYSAFFALYSRTTNGGYTRMSYSRTKVTGIDNTNGGWGGDVTTNTNALVIFIGDSSFSSSTLASSAPTDYLCKLEILVVKDGNTGGTGAASVVYNIVASSSNAVVSANNRLTASLTCSIDRIVGATTTHAYKNANGSVVASIGSDTVTLSYDSQSGAYTLSGYDVDWTTKGRPTHILLSYYISSTLYASLLVSITLTGKMSRNIYFAGLLSEVKERTFDADDHQAPYVNIGTTTAMNCKVYVGANGTNIHFPQTSSEYENSDDWASMDSDFKYLITEAIFANFAKMGSSIFNHDYMFSQWGKANVQSTSMSNAYQNINPSFCSSSSLTLVYGTLNVSGTNRTILANVYMRQGVTYQFGINGLRGTGSGSLTISVNNELGVSQATITFTNSSSSYSATNVTVGTSGYYDIVVYCTDAATAGQITAFRITEQSWSASNAGFIPSILLNLLNGYAHFAGGKVEFQPDGSGFLAGGNVSWNKNGDVTINGSGTFGGAVNATSGTFVNGTFTNVQIGGQSTFKGLLLKQKTTITTETLADYTTSTASGYIINLEKTGTWILFKDFSSTVNIILPSFRGSYVTWEGTKDYARSLVGNTIIIYYQNERTGGSVEIKGRIVSNGVSHDSLNLQEDTFAYLTCKLRKNPTFNDEEVYWDVNTNGVFP